MSIDADRMADLRLDIVANIRAERARRDLTQAQVADGMTRLGYKWHTQTAGLVERGGRPVLADELIALAEVLGCPPGRLWHVPPRQYAPADLPVADWSAGSAQGSAGHEYTEENTYVIKRSGGRTARQCKTCTKAKSAARAEAKRKGA